MRFQRGDGGLRMGYGESKARNIEQRILSRPIGRIEGCAKEKHAPFDTRQGRYSGRYSETKHQRILSRPIGRIEGCAREKHAPFDTRQGR